MNYFNKILSSVIVIAFLLTLPVLSFAQTAPGWYFQGKTEVGIGNEGPYNSQQECNNNKNSYVGRIGSLLKDCYEIVSSNTNNKSNQNNNSSNTNTTIVNPIHAGTVNEVIKTILEGIIKIGMPIIVLAIVYSGFLFVSAQGNTEKLSEAKRSLTYTLIGAAILIGSWAIAQLIVDTVKAL